jgi:hypothetical protein
LAAATACAALLPSFLIVILRQHPSKTPKEASKSTIRQIKRAAAAMVYYKPLSGDAGLGTYFVPMLIDADRNAQYKRAIHAAVADFVTCEGRPPVVMDFGTGTGLLTRYALEGGALKVIAVDTNGTAIALAREALGRDKRVVFYHGTSDAYFEENPGKVDMIVTEIFGTLHTTESMDKYLRGFDKHLNVFADRKVYCVPQAAWTQLQPCCVGSRTDNTDEQRAVNKYRATLLTVMGSITDAWLPTNEMGMLMFTTTSKEDPVVTPCGAPVTLRMDTYKSGADEWGATHYNRQSTAMSWKPLDDGLEHTVNIAVLEFVSQLYGDVMLHNTVQRYNEMVSEHGIAAAIGKHTSWGFMWTMGADEGIATVKLLKYASSRDEAAGMPSVRIGSRDVQARIAENLFAAELRNTFTLNERVQLGCPTWYSSVSAAIVADALEPGVHGVQVRGMASKWVTQYLQEETQLAVFTGGVRTIDGVYARSIPITWGARVATPIRIDFDVLGSKSGAGSSLVVGVQAVTPLLKKTLSRNPAPDISDNEGGMRLELWALPGRRFDSNGTLCVVEEPTLVHIDGVELTITAPHGSVQRKHAMTAAGSARMFMVDGDTIPPFEFTKVYKVRTLMR